MSLNARRYKKRSSSKPYNDRVEGRSDKRNKPKRGGKEGASERVVSKKDRFATVAQTGGCSSCGDMLHMGNVSEPLVCAALHLLYTENPKLTKNISVAGYVHVKPNSQLDREKIDFLVLLSNKLAISLQIKSALSAGKKHSSKNPHISCFIESGSHSLADVSRRLRNFLIEVVTHADPQPPN